jgi:hypothetical protein
MRNLLFISNCFPSIHVLTSYILIKGAMNCEKKASIYSVIITVISSLIILSTQFIRQHVIMDLIFAILLGDIIYKAIENFYVNRNFLQIIKSHWLFPKFKKMGI